MRRVTVVKLFATALTIAGMGWGMNAVLAAQPPQCEAGLGSGECKRCSCFSFQGTGWKCLRGGCGHHYDLHR